MRLPKRKALKAPAKAEDRWLPLVLHFQPSAETYLLAKYLMELTLVDYEMVHYNPSEIAAAALCLSRKVFSQGQWVNLRCRQDPRKLCTPFPKAAEFPWVRLLPLHVVGIQSSTCLTDKSKSSHRIMTAAGQDLP